MTCSSSLQPVVVYNSIEIESTFPASSWDYMAHGFHFSIRRGRNEWLKKKSYENHVKEVSRIRSKSFWRFEQRSLLFEVSKLAAWCCLGIKTRKKIRFLNKIKNVKIKYVLYFKAHFYLLNTLHTSYPNVINGVNKFWKYVACIDLSFKIDVSSDDITNFLLAGDIKIMYYGKILILINNFL